MKEYSEVAKFSFNNKEFILYIDDKGEKFFLQTDFEGNLYYPTIEDYIEIDNILNNPPIPLMVPDSKGYNNNQNNDNYKNNQYYQTNNNINNFQYNNYIQPKKKRKKIRIIPKVIVLGAAITLTPFLIKFYKDQNPEKYQNYNNKITTEYDSTNYEKSKDERTTKALEDYHEDSTEAPKYDPNKFETSAAAEAIRDKLEVDTYIDGKDNYFIYGLEYFDKTPYKDKPTIEQIKAEIDKNSKITDGFKVVINQYVDDLYRTYPDIDCRVFIQNIKDLNVEKCSKSQMSIYTGSDDSIGCYVRGENKICVLEDYDPNKDMWSKQIMYHELTHCLRTGIFEKDGIKYTVKVAGLGFDEVIQEEALTSVFAVSLFDYEEKDIAYQLQSNMTKVLVEELDNYSLEDYVNQSLSYYAKKLDDFTGTEEGYSMNMLALMQFQYDDFHSDRINADQETYYRLYDYISDVYYKNHINSEMSYDEAKIVTDELVEKIMYDVPDDYNIDTNHFYDHLKDYCKNMGIEVKEKTR